MDESRQDQVKEAVRAYYGMRAQGLDPCSCSCGPEDCCGPEQVEERSSDCSEQELCAVQGDPQIASLGCGDPLAFADIREGEVVLALGSGLGLDVIVQFLTAQGYQVEATRINASDVGAPHRRQRLFVIAWRVVGDAHGEGELQQGAPLQQSRRRTSHAGGAVADAAGLGRSEGDLGQRGQAGPTSPGASAGASERGVGGGSHGLPRRLDRRWPAGRGVDQHPWEPPRTVPARSQADRKARVKALGNAVVPQVAAIVGERLAHHLNKTFDA